MFELVSKTLEKDHPHLYIWLAYLHCELPGWIRMLEHRSCGEQFWGAWKPPQLQGSMWETLSAGQSGGDDGAECMNEMSIEVGEPCNSFTELALQLLYWRRGRPGKNWCHFLTVYEDFCSTDHIPQEVHLTHVELSLLCFDIQFVLLEPRQDLLDMGDVEF